MAYPIYSAAQQPVMQDISRQRKLSDLLRNEAMQQEQGQMVSGHYVAPSITQHLAHLLQAYQSKQASDNADTQEKNYATGKSKAFADLLSNTQAPVADNAPQVAPQPTQQAVQAVAPNFNVMPQADAQTAPQAPTEQAMPQVMPQAQPMDQRAKVMKYIQDYGDTPEAQFALNELNHTRGRDEALGDRTALWNHEDVNHTRDVGEKRADMQTGYAHEDASQLAGFNHADKSQLAGFVHDNSINSGNHAFEAAQNKMKLDAANPMGIGTAQSNGLKGNEFLSTIPENQASQIKALAEGRMSFPTGMALKSPYWQQMLSAVGQYDPNFDAVNYNARAKTRADFTSGKGAMNIKALNTAIGHLGHLDDQAGDTASHAFTPLNAVENYISAKTGGSGVTNYAQTADALANELTQVFRGSGGAEADVKRYLEQLSTDASAEQKKAAVKNITSLLHARTSAIGDQYNQGMGTTKDPLTLLNPEAQKVINRINGTDASKAVFHYDAQGNLVK